MHAFRPFILVATASMLAAPAVPAAGQDGLANRYTMEKTENGLVRLDTLTGEMTKCIEQAGQIVCRLAADEGKAVEDRISELEDRIVALEDRIAVLSANPPADREDKFPDDAEIDRTLGVMEKFMRRFFGVFKDLSKEFEALDEPAGPAPDRT